MIKHHPSCTSDYPEKPQGEPAQHTTDIDIGDSTIRQCSDCGAYESHPKQSSDLYRVDGETSPPITAQAKSEQDLDPIALAPLGSSWTFVERVYVTVGGRVPRHAGAE